MLEGRVRSERDFERLMEGAMTSAKPWNGRVMWESGSVHACAAGKTVFLKNSCEQKVKAINEKFK